MFIAKNLARLLTKLLLAAAPLLLLLSCATPARHEPATNAAASPRATPSPKPPAAPPPVAPDAEKASGSGSFEQYRFTYVRTGEEVLADFKQTKLPRTNQNVVVAAARRVIHAAYGERLENFPRLVAWDYKDTKHAIKLEGEQHDYVFVPIKDGDRDIQQLIFWRVAKGTVQ